MIARDTEDGQHQKLALHGIEQLEVLDECSTPDPAFDPDRHAGASSGLFRGRPVHAVVELDPVASHLFTERQFHPGERVLPASTGVRVVLEVAGTIELDELREHHQRGLAR